MANTKPGQGTGKVPSKTGPDHVASLGQIEPRPIGKASVPPSRPPSGHAGANPIGGSNPGIGGTGGVAAGT